jgi:bifunctional non-homologous end joining protein LigD
VVFKQWDAIHTAGRPNTGVPQRKHKFVESASAIVTAVNARRSVALGLHDGTRLVPAGNVTIPPNHPVPEAGEVVEVRYLYAMPESGALFQPVYLGKREDVEPGDCLVTQLKYRKSPEMAYYQDLLFPPARVRLVLATRL